MSQTSSTLSFKWRVMNFKILYCHKYQMNPFQPLFFVILSWKILQKKSESFSYSFLSSSLSIHKIFYLMLLQFNLNIDLKDTEKMNDGFIILITTQLCWFFCLSYIHNLSPSITCLERNLHHLYYSSSHVW